jgi:hypothetical protein
LQQGGERVLTWAVSGIGWPIADNIASTELLKRTREWGKMVNSLSMRTSLYEIDEENELELLRGKEDI